MKKVRFRHIALLIVLALMFRSYYSGNHSNETTYLDPNVDNDANIITIDNDYTDTSSVTPNYVYSNGNANLSYRLIDRTTGNSNNNRSNNTNSSNTSYGSTDVWSQINYAVENMLPSVTVASSTPWTWVDMLALQYGAANLASYSYSTNYNSITYYFTYNTASLSQYATMKAEIDSVAAQIIAGIPSGTTNTEKARMLHDWLVVNTTYDYTFSDPNSHNIYGVFHDHLATCSGFAAAYKFLMNRIGLDCSIVASSTHAWNQISSNPNIYVDCCWDNYDYASDNGQEYIIYDYFALEESEILTVSEHTSIVNRSQSTLSSHPEYWAGDSIATVSFDSYNTESITYYCNQMRELGYVCFTLDFDNAGAYQTAVNELPYYMYDLAFTLNIPESMCYTTNDSLHTFTIFVGEWHDMVANRG